MRKLMLPDWCDFSTVPRSQDMNPNQADFKIHTNPTAPPMSLCRILIYIPWDFLNSLLSAFLLRTLPMFLFPSILKKSCNYWLETQKELRGMECRNYELKAFQDSSSFSSPCLPNTPPPHRVWTCNYSAWQPSFSLHIPPPLQSSIWPEHSIVSAPFPLENVESELTLTPIRELCSCSHAARPKAFRKLFAFTCLLYSWQLCQAWQPRTALG